jgi:hypothetical protein
MNVLSPMTTAWRKAEPATGRNQMRTSGRPFLGSAMLAGAMLGFCALLTVCCQGQGTADPSARLAARPSAPEQARFYRVPLVCPAAPQIGCGSAAKPILLSLEQSEAVSEAWLNRAGTVVAVLWSKQTTRKQRSKTLKAVLEERQLSAREVHGREKQEAWNSFRRSRGLAARGLECAGRAKRPAEAGFRTPWTSGHTNRAQSQSGVALRWPPHSKACQARRDKCMALSRILR